MNNNRADADYYQVKYRQLDKVLSKFSSYKIKQISEPLETGLYSSAYGKTGNYYIRGVDIENGYINPESIYKTISLLKSYKSIVKEDDILVTRIGSIGVCGIVEDSLSGAFYSDNLIRIRIKRIYKSEIYSSYLNLLLNKQPDKCK